MQSSSPWIKLVLSFSQFIVVHLFVSFFHLNWFLLSRYHHFSSPRSGAGSCRSRPGRSRGRPTLASTPGPHFLIIITLGGPKMNLLQKLKLLLSSFQPGKRTQHIKQLLNERLLVSYSGRPVLIIEILDQLLELLKFGMVIDKKRMNSQKVEVSFGESSLPPGQLQSLLQVTTFWHQLIIQCNGPSLFHSIFNLKSDEMHRRSASTQKDSKGPCNILLKLFLSTIILLWVSSRLQPLKDIDCNLSSLTPSNLNPRSSKANNSIVPSNLYGIILIAPPIELISTTTPITSTTRKPKPPLSNNLKKKIENRQNRKEYQGWPTLGIELGSSFIKLKAKECISKIERGRNQQPLNLLLVLSLVLTEETKVR